MYISQTQSQTFPAFAGRLKKSLGLASILTLGMLSSGCKSEPIDKFTSVIARADRFTEPSVYDPPPLHCPPYGRPPYGPPYNGPHHNGYYGECREQGRRMNGLSQWLTPDGKVTRHELSDFIRETEAGLKKAGSKNQPEKVLRKHEEKQIAEFLLQHFDRIALEHTKEQHMTLFNVSRKPHDQGYLNYLKSYITEGDLHAIAQRDGNPADLSEADFAAQNK